MSTTTFTACPICKKRVEFCRCVENVKENRYKVVIDHLYLLSLQELLHLCNLQKSWDIQYNNPKVQKIWEEYREERKDRKCDKNAQ